MLRVDTRGVRVEARLVGTIPVIEEIKGGVWIILMAVRMVWDIHIETRTKGK